MADTRRKNPRRCRQYLVNQSSQPGDVVADPFMGSGSVGVAAAKLGRRFLGNDLNPEAVRLAAERLRDFGTGRAPEELPASIQPGLLDAVSSRRDRGRIRQSRCLLPVASVRVARPEGVQRSQDRQDDHRKDRCIDVFCLCEANNKAFAIECRYQDSLGTVDEKIPYALDDLQALPMAACIAYAGTGFSRASCTCSGPPAAPPTACRRSTKAIQQRPLANSITCSRPISNGGTY